VQELRRIPHTSIRITGISKYFFTLNPPSLLLEKARRRNKLKSGTTIIYTIYNKSITGFG
jgi:hypothetical protein